MKSVNKLLTIINRMTLVNNKELLRQVGMCTKLKDQCYLMELKFWDQKEYFLADCQYPGRLEI